MFGCCSEQPQNDINNQLQGAMLANPQWLAHEKVRLQNELQEIIRLDGQFRKTYGKETEVYLISSKWFEKWREFVRLQLAEPNVYLGSMLPILNQDIVSKETPVVFYDPPFENQNLFLKENLKEVSDYRIVNKAIWDVLCKYNGIPVRRTLKLNQQGKLFPEAYYERIQCICFSGSILRRVVSGQIPSLPIGPIQLSKFQNFQTMLLQITKSLCKRPNSHGLFIPNSQCVRYWRINDQINLHEWINQKARAIPIFDSVGAKLRIPFQKQAQLLTQDITDIDIKPATTILIETIEQEGAWVLFSAKAPVIGWCPGCMNWKFLKYMCYCRVYFYCNDTCYRKVQPQHQNACDVLQQKSVPGLQPMKSYQGRSGVINSGNSCYMNACVQCLCSIQPLNQLFIRDQYRKYCKDKALLSESYADLLRKVFSGNNFAVSPQRLKNQISKRFPQFVGCNQQDSSEFLLCLLNTLSDQLSVNPQATNINNASPLNNLFYGQLESKLCCTSCSNLTTTFEPFLLWELPVLCPTELSISLRLIISCNSVVETTITCPADKKISYLIGKVRELYSVAADEILAYLATPSEFQVIPSSYSVQNVSGRTDCRLYLRKLEYEEVYLDGIYSGLALSLQGNLLCDMVVFSFRQNCYGWQVMEFFKRYFNGQRNSFGMYQSTTFINQPKHCLYCTVGTCLGCLPANLTLYQLTMFSANNRGHLSIQMKWQTPSKQLNEFVQVIKDKNTAPTKYQVDIQSSIAAFSKEEEIDNYNCQGCGKRGKALKKFGIKRLPSHLIIHLKRFINGPTTSQKIEIPVTYPQVLGLNPPTSQKAQYQLTAVCKHQGTLDSGHYTAEFIDFNTGYWYKVDDQTITRLSHINPANGYLLFYSRFR